MNPAKAKKLQEMLNKVARINPPLNVDGVLGKKSKAAIKQMQKMAGLKQTGEIDTETAPVITRAMKTGKIEKEQPQVFVKIGGKYVGMTQQEYDTLRKKIAKDLERGPLLQMKIAAAAADSEWQHFFQLNKEQSFVAFCIETTRGVSLPSKSMIKAATKSYEQCAAAVSSGNLEKFYSIYPKGEKTVNSAVDAMRNYREAMIDGGGNWVTGLKFTKTGSFVFVGVFAAPAAGAALGTGVVASAMIGGAAVSATETAAGEIGNWSAGKANWTPGGAIKKTLIDGGVGAILGFLAKGGSGGKHIIEATVSRLMPKLAKEVGFKLLSATTLKKVALYLLTEGGKKTLEGVIGDLAKAAKGDPKMTLDKLLDNLSVNFLKGVGMGPVGKVIEKFAKNASKSLDAKDKQKIWDVVLKELSKQAKGKTIHIDAINKRSQELADKIINDQIAKQLDNVIGVIYDNWKGTMSPAAFEKKLREELVSPARVKIMSAQITKKVGKEVLKSAA